MTSDTGPEILKIPIDINATFTHEAPPYVLISNR